MNDEQKQVVAELRKHGLSNSSMGYHSGWMDEAADMIERLAAEIDTLRAQNERIRQSSVTHEAHQMVLDELEKEKNKHQHTEECADKFESAWKRAEKDLNQVKRERDAAAKIINDARTYLDELGSPRFCLMQLKKWPCAENGGAPDGD